MAELFRLVNYCILYPDHSYEILQTFINQLNLANLCQKGHPDLGDFLGYPPFVGGFRLKIAQEHKDGIKGFQNGGVVLFVQYIWVNYNDLTRTSLQMMVSKGNHPKMVLIQVSYIIIDADQMCHWVTRTSQAEKESETRGSHKKQMLSKQLSHIPSCNSWNQTWPENPLSMEVSMQENN